MTKHYYFVEMRGIGRSERHSVTTKWAKTPHLMVALGLLFIASQSLLCSDLRAAISAQPAQKPPSELPEFFVPPEHSRPSLGHFRPPLTFAAVSPFPTA